MKNITRAWFDFPRRLIEFVASSLPRGAVVATVFLVACLRAQTPAEPLRDLFGPLRDASKRFARTPPDWRTIAQNLARLKTLDGFAVDAETGQVVLYGTVGAEPGPFRLDDLFVALRGTFFERESLGMTIDENKDDKRGPTMPVRFFAGSAQSHLGEVMFECDRLMKGLGLGKDTLSREPITSNVPHFANQGTLAQRLVSSAKDDDAHPWERFWITLTTDRFPENDGRGKALVAVSRRNPAIWFQHHRLFVDNEKMIDPGQGQRLESSGGQQSKSGMQFADHFTQYYPEFAAERPVFGHLHEISKLVVGAAWVFEKKWPLDPELLFCRAPERVETPEHTRSLETTTEWTTGNTIHKLTLFGGVLLKPQTKFVAQETKDIEAFDALVNAHRQPLREGRVVPLPNAARPSHLLISIGPTTTAPPALRQRRSIRMREASGRLEPIAQTGSHPVLGRYDLPAWIDPVTGRELLNLPVLRTVSPARETAWGEIGIAKDKMHRVDMPRFRSLVSPLGDINLKFSDKLDFDVTRNEPFFSAENSAVKYYPESGSVRLADGGEYHFTADGTVDKVAIANGPTVNFQHPRYVDGPFVQTSSDPTGRPRGPPIRTTETTGTVTATSGAPRGLGELLITARGTGGNAALDVRSADGTLQHIDR